MAVALEELTAQVSQKPQLGPEDVRWAVHGLTSSDIPDATKADFLQAMSLRGETAVELAEFARVFRGLAVDPNVADLSQGAIDIVGTGGDHAGGFNISTLVVLTLASLGVPVMKHGNRGITSKCGSADLFAGLGVNLEAPLPKLRAALQQLGYVFFFAPAFHPAFKNIVPVRKMLAAKGHRTLFNILGPMVNPGRPGHALLGVFSAPWVRRLADAFHELGLNGGLAAHGIIAADRGIDEMTTTTSNRVRGFGQHRNEDSTWEPEHFGFERRPFADLVGGDLGVNLQLVDAILSGKAPAGLIDTIVFNAATALWVVGRVASVKEGVAPAREQLLGGGVRAKIAATREFFAT